MFGLYNKEAWEMQTPLANPVVPDVQTIVATCFSASSMVGGLNRLNYNQRKQKTN